MKIRLGKYEKDEFDAPLVLQALLEGYKVQYPSGDEDVTWIWYDGAIARVEDDEIQSVISYGYELRCFVEWVNFLEHIYILA